MQVRFLRDRETMGRAREGQPPDPRAPNETKESTTILNGSRTKKFLWEEADHGPGEENTGEGWSQ